MAFIVEDGTGLQTATSYVSVEFAVGYFADRGMTGFPTDLNAQQAALVQATDYIDRRFGGAFKGCQLNYGIQALEWPRVVNQGPTWGWDWPFGPSPIDDPPTSPQPLPVALQKACCEYAFRAAKAMLAPDPVVDPSGFQVSRLLERVGPIQTQTDYATQGQGSQRLLIIPYPLADMLLRPILKGGMTQGTVIRH